MEEPVWLGLKIGGKACSSLESWMNKFVRFFLMEWGHGAPSLVIFNLFLKFGSKQSTLNFWVFGPRAQFLTCSQNEIKITLEDKPNGFLQICELIWSPLVEMNKTQKSFRNRRILIFQPNFVKTQFLQKSRWFSSETVEGGCEKINKGYQNL